MWRCHDLGVGDSVTQVGESPTLAVAPTLCELKYANVNTLLFLLVPACGGQVLIQGHCMVRTVAAVPAEESHNANESEKILS
jgi:hypothetical protein